MTKRFRILIAVSLAAAWAWGMDCTAQQQQDERVRQVLVSFEDLDYPAVARATRHQGIVVVDVALDGNGVPVSAAALIGPELLIPHATANAKKWRFKPNLQRRAIIVYEFSIDPGVCHDSKRSLFVLRYDNFAQIRSCESVLEGRGVQPAEKR